MKIPGNKDLVSPAIGASVDFVESLATAGITSKFMKVGKVRDGVIAFLPVLLNGTLYLFNKQSKLDEILKGAYTSSVSRAMERAARPVITKGYPELAQTSLEGELNQLEQALGQGSISEEIAELEKEVGQDEDDFLGIGDAGVTQADLDDWEAIG